MEQLSRSEHFASPLPPDAAKRILLFDCDNRRRKNRAEALMKRGALVDSAAETIAARTLWKPGAYDLLLIDLRGADADCAAFISFVHRECCTQKVGFYVAEPPYLTASVAECRSSLKQEMSRGLAADQHQSVSPSDRGGDNLVVAARRIAAFKQGVRIRAGSQAAQEPHDLANREDRSPAVAVSDAMELAARILGGS